MSGTQRTPGPWHANSWGSSVETRAHDLPLDRVHGYGSDYTFICSLNDGEYHEYKDGSEQLANARLIAAAPDLYAALAKLIPSDFAEHPDDFMPEWHDAVAAIARATGAA